MKNYKLYKVFPTPVFHFIVEDYEKLNNDVKKYILNLQKEDEGGQKKSNYGGWHSYNFDIVNDKIAKKLAIIFEKYYKMVIVEMGWKYDPNRTEIEAMWSIINNKGSFNIQHNHPNAFLSSAYYVKYPENSGKIKFYDPREQKNIRYPKINKLGELSAPTVDITPKEGDLLIFPSYLSHAVAKNLSEEDRIIVSFNVDIKYK